MIRTDLNDGWSFSQNGAPYIEINLPHDYAVTSPRDRNAPGGAGNGFFHGGRGTYVRCLRFPEGQHCILDIDGAYMCAEIRLNNDIYPVHPHGYTPFLTDLTEHIRQGELNRLCITTDDHQPSSRWYAGAGLYRRVGLWTGGCVRVEPWDLFVTTPEADVAHIICPVTADAPMNADIRWTLNAPDGTVAASAFKSISLKTGKNAIEFDLNVPDALAWDLETPNLYTLRTVITVDGEITDTAENTFGFRQISYTADHGFQLNGVEMKLRGGCIHHDHGALGAAAYPQAEARKLFLLKKAGFNAVRISHNPPSSALMEAADRIGMLVLDEAFDYWTDGKREHDYHLWFQDHYARDIAAMVRRDRNHPCIIAYSIGNEIRERDGRGDGMKWAAILADEVRKHDITRPVTSAVCGFWEDHYPEAPEDYRQDMPDWGNRTEDFFKPLDICGYNYLPDRYEKDHLRYPDRIIWGSETHALRFAETWPIVMRNPYIIGDFTWTAYDNLGESGTGRALWARDGYIDRISLADYPWRTCWQGDLDLCGYRRPQSYAREAVWLGTNEPHLFTTHPDHYGESYSGTQWHWWDEHETWTFGEEWIGKPVLCRIYTDADEVIWTVNGRKLGTTKPEGGASTIDVPYEPGTLCAACMKNGAPAGTAMLRTTGTAAKIMLDVDASCQDSFADGPRALSYIRVTLVDENGCRVDAAKNELSAEVKNCTLKAIFSADPANEDDWTSNRCHAFDGRALVVVEYPRDGGDFTVTVSSEGLGNTSLTINCQAK